MGVHSKYCEELQDFAEEYIADSTKHGDVVPSVVGMAVAMNIAKSTLYLWAKQDRGIGDGDDRRCFSDTLEKCCDVQHKMLLNGGLENTYNSAITKLMLASHGHTEKTASELSGPGGKPIEVDTVWKVELVNAQA